MATLIKNHDLYTTEEERRIVWKGAVRNPDDVDREAARELPKFVYAVIEIESDLSENMPLVIEGYIVHHQDIAVHQCVEIRCPNSRADKLLRKRYLYMGNDSWVDLGYYVD